MSSGQFVEGDTVAFERYEQMVNQVAGLVADVVVIVIFAGHDDLARLLGKLLEQLVLDVGQQASGIALLRRRVATAMNHLGQTRQRLADISILNICGAHTHSSILSVLPSAQQGARPTRVS